MSSGSQQRAAGTLLPNVVKAAVLLHCASEVGAVSIDMNSAQVDAMTGFSTQDLVDGMLMNMA